MRRALLAMAVGAVACALGAGRGGEVAGKLVSVSAHARVKVDKQGRGEMWYTVSAGVKVTGAEDRCVITHGEFTQALDEGGENLVVPPRRRVEHRSRMEFLFRSLGRGSRGVTQPTATVARLPRKFAVLKGYAAGYVAERVVVVEAPLASMREPEEIVPGVTFQWTAVRVGERTATLSYEVRIARGQGERAGLEPVWGGLDIRTADGRPVPVTTPDRARGLEGETVITANNFQVPLRGEQEPRIAVRVYDGIREVKVEFEARDVAVSE